MPIISKVNARSWKGRSLVFLIYLVLVVGTATMVYPFLLMLSGSIRSEADSTELTIIPRFWHDETVLFRKFVESKYTQLQNLQKTWGRRPGSFRLIEPPPAEHPYLEEYLAWRGQSPWWEVGHAEAARMLGRNARLYRKDLYRRFDKDLDRFKQAMKLPVKSWNQVTPSIPLATRTRRQDHPSVRDWYAFAEKLPVDQRYPLDQDAEFVAVYLMAAYTSRIESYNQAHGTDYADYDQIVLANRAADTEGLEREDWEYYVRNELKLQFIRLDPKSAPSYRAFLQEQLYVTIDEYNTRFETSFSAFEEIPSSIQAPHDRVAQVDWEKFIKSKDHCSLEHLEVWGARQHFEDFVAKRRGLSRDAIGPIRLPVKEADYHDLMQNLRYWRWEMTRRNYLHVLDFILLHGNGIKNTVIYCALAIGAALLINPLAAYALSRYKPPSTYKILLFFMATMAFPGEVTMIPAFLLLKRFPFWPLLSGLVTFIGVLWILNRTARRLPEMLRLTSALVSALLVGVWLLPAMMHRSHLSLLNTFWALILPGAAQGFFIFLLKGFFDSLPRELYESADIDGAGEWTKFWSITMNLSQPILAVIALSAFVSAYSAFMMALIIIPDPDMWTLMVWIFQLQSSAHQSVVYASLVITAIPTFLVFAFCQNIIIRGIVVPVEK